MAPYVDSHMGKTNFDSNCLKINSIKQSSANNGSLIISVPMGTDASTNILFRMVRRYLIKE